MTPLHGSTSTADAEVSAPPTSPTRASAAALTRLLREVRACTLCAEHLPLPPRPVLQAAPGARILIAAQAPGRRVAQTGVPFDDASGERLRAWMGVDADTFYDASRIAILPMGLCYPGAAAGGSGDLPPRPECAPRWRQRVLDQLPRVELTLVIGTHAMAWHLGRGAAASLTRTVRDWRAHAPALMPLPHPSPRNNGWFKHNPWFEADVVPALRARVQQLLG